MRTYSKSVIGPPSRRSIPGNSDDESVISGNKSMIKFDKNEIPNSLNEHRL